jgi:hypothetical protein
VEVGHINRSSAGTHHPKVYTSTKKVVLIRLKHDKRVPADACQCFG